MSKKNYKKGDSVVVMNDGWNEVHCVLMENLDKQGWAMAKGHSFTLDTQPGMFMVHIKDIVGKLKYAYSA